MCFELSIDYESLGGRGASAKVETGSIYNISGSTIGGGQLMGKILLGTAVIKATPIIAELIKAVSLIF